MLRAMDDTTHEDSPPADSPKPAPKTLGERAPTGPASNDDLLEIFLEWAIDLGIELYDHQEEAVLEIMEGRHVVLNTPTGSGKSLVALAMHFRAFATGRRSVYTSPIKALVSEKFFDLCKQFGAKNVGMLTGDASINPKAEIIACTAEVLAAMALSEGDAASVHYAIMDEFHYYGDRDRGMAWQIPLLTLTKTRFLLMSATLGDTEHLRRNLTERTGVETALVKTSERPVPLEFSYSEEPVHEAIQDLISQNRAPIYVVNFTQRDCAEMAQSLTSINFCSKEEKKAIAKHLRGFRFDTPYGKDLSKYVRHGIGLHHAGLLPKYRLMVEQLAQAGMLKIIVGTDTLGVGINVPIRTVLFTKLCKYDGRKTRILTVRDFKQIAGRAGRKGFDDKGWVVCQAPEHAIDNKRMAGKAAGDKRKLRKMVKKKAPERGYAHWNEATFERLRTSDSEALVSRFNVDHGMLLNLLQQSADGYRMLIDLIAQNHEADHRKRRLRREAKELFKQLRAAGIIEVSPRLGRKGQTVQVAEELQSDFSMYHSLSLFLLYALGQLPADDPDYEYKVLSLAEAILEDPHAILRQQMNHLRSEAYGRLKAEGMDYDERQDELEKITWPMPDADWIFEVFDGYAKARPWVRVDRLSPKSVARDMYERYASFNDYVGEYGLERIEGALLRHLSQVYKVLLQTVPEPNRTDDVVALIAYLRSVLQKADSSLVKAWETMVHGAPLEDAPTAPPPPPKPADIARNQRMFYARLRAEMHAVVKALAWKNYEEAAISVRTDAPDNAVLDPEDIWDANRFEEALVPYFAEYTRLVFNHQARGTALTRINADGDRQWRVLQVLCDPEEDNIWYVEARVDLRGATMPEGPLIAMERITR